MAKVKDDGNCYVYVLLDTRKPGPFRYGRWTFSHEPFYVGKGNGNRAYHHFRSNSWGYNKFKGRLVAKIQKETGADPQVCIKRDRMTEAAAFDLEATLIAKIGRRKNRLGPLVNLTDGGEGNLGNPWTQKTRKRVMAARKKAWDQMTAKRRKEIAESRANGVRATAAIEFEKGVAENNPGITVLEPFKGQRGYLKVRLSCGCEVERPARTLKNKDCDYCFPCAFEYHIRKHCKGILLLNRPTGTRDKAQYMCSKGHTFTQQARCKYYGSHPGCPECNRLGVTKILNDYNRNRHSKQPKHGHLANRGGLSKTSRSGGKTSRG